MLQEGDIVAGFRIDAPLAEGATAVVYRATQESLERTVALKVLSAQLSEDPGFSERFRREGQLQAAIDHPHIVTVYEAGESEYGLYLAMRLIHGPTLKETIVAERPDPRWSVQILSQVADALDAAHEVGLIHRDVKPQNVLDRRARPRLSRRLRADQGPRLGVPDVTGQFIGTIDYISPEQARGEGRPLEATSTSSPGSSASPLRGGPLRPADRGRGPLRPPDRAAAEPRRALPGPARRARRCDRARDGEAARGEVRLPG